MRVSAKLLLLLWFPVLAMAQDSVTIISPSDFNKTSDQVFVAKMNGWFFKEGNDTAWAKEGIEINGWKKMKPIELSEKYADKDGRMEGWFRIRIKIDSAIGNKEFGIKISTWAASDLYVNGHLISSFGNTGLNGEPYRELSPYGLLPVAVNLKPGNVYTIALHIVDYLSPLPPRRLKSEDADLASLIRITGPAYSLFFLNTGIKEASAYHTIWIAVSTILGLLFWLLYFQNPFEKNLRLIAIGISSLALGALCMSSSLNDIGLSYTAFLLLNFGSNLFFALSSVTMPLILVNIFKRYVTAGLKIFLTVFFIGFNIAGFLPNNPGGIIIFGLLGMLFGICIYYMTTSWKNLRGAQWSIVAGLLLSLLWALVFCLTIIFASTSIMLFHLSVTGYALSFPLSLLVYVSMRFKEIINEVRQNSKQVVQLSEEKKERALNQQKILQEEVDRQTAELRTTLTNLKETQSLLIQSEKMASLGELTAGIAHEIQNPLNFVNNFADVNTELIDDLEKELVKRNVEEVKTLAKSIRENEEKIVQHGKRADSIVKGMLQHSRRSTGVKEPMDINVLADEYLRLAYHGIRARDKSFNATIKTNYDDSAGKVNIIPQDIGRVLLNLYNNAFYAAAEKLNQEPGGFEPTVSVSTAKMDGRVEISVKDNGNGIPQKLMDKIFQPFFTTKPAGQGTGLGLSLSYDIVKAHGGELKVNTKEGEGSEFLVQIPAV